MLRQKLNLTRFELFYLMVVIGLAAVGASYFFQHGRNHRRPLFPWADPRFTTTKEGVQDTALINGEMGDEAGHERLIAVLKEFATQKGLTIQVWRFPIQNHLGYDIKMWRGSTNIVGGNDVTKLERFELVLIEDDPDPGRVAFAKSLMEELRQAIGQVQGVTRLDLK